MTYVLYSVDADGRAAREAVREATAFYLAAMPDNALSEVYGIQPPLQELIASGELARELPAAWLDDLAVAGDPDEAAAKIRALLDAGSDSVCLWLFPLDRGEEILELTAREVLPEDLTTRSSMAQRRLLPQPPARRRRPGRVRGLDPPRRLPRRPRAGRDHELHGHAHRGTLSGEGESPYDYLEVIEISDLEAYRALGSLPEFEQFLQEWSQYVAEAVMIHGETIE